MIQTRADLAEALTTLRKRAGHTMRSAAEAADIPPTTIGGYMNGRHLPTRQDEHLFARLLTVLDVRNADEHAEWMRTLARVRNHDLRTSTPAARFARAVLLPA